MNTPESNFWMIFSTMTIAWLSIMWLANYSMNFFAKIFNWISREKLGRKKWILKSAITIKNFLMIILGLMLFCEYFSKGIKEHDEFIASYVSPHQKKLAFLKEHCEQVDIEYEILNNDQSIYKCPNGKEYRIKI